MGGLGAIAFIKELLPLIMLAINGAIELVPVVQEGLARVKTMTEEGRDPTDADWTWINTQIAEKRARIRAKLGAHNA